MNHLLTKQPAARKKPLSGPQLDVESFLVGGSFVVLWADVILAHIRIFE